MVADRDLPQPAAGVSCWGWPMTRGGFVERRVVGGDGGGQVGFGEVVGGAALGGVGPGFEDVEWVHGGRCIVMMCRAWALDGTGAFNRVYRGRLVRFYWWGYVTMRFAMGVSGAREK